MAFGIQNHYNHHCCEPNYPTFPRFPGPFQPQPQPWPCPSPWNWNETRGNLENATVGRHGFLGLERTQGYAVDTNGDGRYTPGKDAVLAMDLNHDGRLDAGESSRADGRVLVDSNRDGKFQPWEQHSPYNFPTGGFGKGRLNYIDPYCGTTSINQRSPWSPGPWGPGPWGPRCC